MVSEAYKSKSSCQNGVKSVQKNADLETNYIRKASKDGKHYFVLVAANKKIVATSTRHATAALRDKAMATAQKMAPQAQVIPLEKQMK